MVSGQLASAAMMFTKFHAGIRKSLSDFLLPGLEQPIEFVLILSNNKSLHVQKMKLFVSNFANN